MRFRTDIMDTVLNIVENSEFKNDSIELNYLIPEVPKALIVSEQRLNEFLSYYPEIIRELTDQVTRMSSNESVGDQFKKALEYNLTGGKHTRSMIFLKTYDLLVPEKQHTEEHMKLSTLMGWMIELLHTAGLIVDDILDAGQTRRGQKCWYLKENVGMTVFPCAVAIKESVFYLLRTHFRHLDCYSKLIDIFHQVIYRCMIGELGEAAATHQSVYDFDVNSYEQIAVNKTSYYTFYLPVTLAMTLAGVTDPEEFQRARKILVEIGRIFQIQDDYLDCFGEPELSGTVGTDIQESKCTWLAVEFMQRADDKQKKLMAEHYGKKGDESAKIVKQLYEDVVLPSVYAKYEKECFDRLRKELEEMPHIMLNEVYFLIIERISGHSC